MAKKAASQPTRRRAAVGDNSNGELTPLDFMLRTLRDENAAPEDRRWAIAAIAAKHGLIVIEDDVYGFLSPDAPSPLAVLLPEQVCYVGSFSKIFSFSLSINHCFVNLPRSYIILFRNF